MKKITNLLLIFALALALLAGCGNSNKPEDNPEICPPVSSSPETNSPAPEDSAPPISAIDPEEWKTAYLAYIDEANDYSHRVNEGEEDADFDGDYPVYLYGAHVADLNFDGVPEMLLYGDGAGAAATLRIFTYADGKCVEILRDWGNPGRVMRYKSLSDDSLAYSFPSENGEEFATYGAIYFTTADTVMDESFADSAKILSYEWRAEIEYNESTYEMKILSETFTIDGAEVSKQEFEAKKAAHLEGYESFESEIEGGGLDSLAVTAEEISAAFDAFIESNK